MFEKEAEEYAEKGGLPKEKYLYGLKAMSFKDGAEFGYNKANEWHYPSKGELPKCDEETNMFEKEAEEYYYKTYPVTLNIGEEERKKEVTDIFLAGLKAGKDMAETDLIAQLDQAKEIINELLMNSYDENTREKALNFLYPDKKED